MGQQGHVPSHGDRPRRQLQCRFASREKRENGSEEVRLHRLLLHLSSRNDGNAGRPALNSGIHSLSGGHGTSTPLGRETLGPPCPPGNPAPPPPRLTRSAPCRGGRAKFPAPRRREPGRTTALGAKPCARPRVIRASKPRTVRACSVLANGMKMAQFRTVRPRSGVIPGNILPNFC